jgi:hypothetical protein
MEAPAIFPERRRLRQERKAMVTSRAYFTSCHGSCIYEELKRQGNVHLRVVTCGLLREVTGTGGH